MQIQLVVFDIAGTTVADPGLVELAFLGALHSTGRLMEPAQVREWMGYAKPEAIAQLLGVGADSPLVASVHAEFVARMRVSLEQDPRVQPLPGAEAVFARLRRAGVQVALNTGFCTHLTAALLRRLQWEALIDTWVASDQVGAARPAPDMIQLLMQRCGIVDPASVAKVGDTPVDIAEARAAGVGLCVAVASGAHGQAELSALGPDYVINALDALPALLGLPQTA
ncbi:MAG TPA: HAD-IA family hydrolase [Stenotrophomonas sp.]|nr:HAD-IA family hydrolase [Stenotrophomonas sp.]